MTDNHKPDIRKANQLPPLPQHSNVWDTFIYWLGIGLGSGKPQRAPGTWGTVGGLLIALPMLWLGFWGFLTITLIVGLIGSYICGRTSELMGVHDDPHIVFDEWVGMWISLLPIVWLYHEHSLLMNQPLSLLLLLFVAFVAFRFFDIIKPFPIKWVDKNVSGGFGILIDDVLAGLMAGVCIWTFIHFFASILP